MHDLMLLVDDDGRRRVEIEKLQVEVGSGRAHDRLRRTDRGHRDREAL
jgi:hypothetical protein